jgi:hypothetical protein
VKALNSGYENDSDTYKKMVSQKGLLPGSERLVSHVLGMGNPRASAFGRSFSFFGKVGPKHRQIARFSGACTTIL